MSHLKQGAREFLAKIKRFTWWKDRNQSKAEFGVLFYHIKLLKMCYWVVVLGFCGVVFLFRKQSLVMELPKMFINLKSPKTRIFLFKSFSIYLQSVSTAGRGKKMKRLIKNRSCVLPAVPAHCFASKCARNSKGSYLEEVLCCFRVVFINTPKRISSLTST